MPLNHTLLGLLSCGPMTGYDMKKIIQASPWMHWSGNNNQIYKALVEILAAGLVSKETLYQDDGPAKKMYSLTQAGWEALRQWALEPSEPAEVKRSFFLHLAWAAEASQEQLAQLLAGYEEEVRGRMLLERESRRRGRFSPGRSQRETLIWDAMYDRIEGFYAEELRWVQDLRQRIEEEQP